MHIYKSKLSGINDNEITQILSTTWTLQFTSLLVQLMSFMIVVVRKEMRNKILEGLEES